MKPAVKSHRYLSKFMQNHNETLPDIPPSIQIENNKNLSEHDTDVV